VLCCGNSPTVRNTPTVHSASGPMPKFACAAAACRCLAVKQAIVMGNPAVISRWYGTTHAAAATLVNVTFLQ
jgi:hypothetical protein